MTKKQKRVLKRILLSAALLVAVSLLPEWGWVTPVLFLIPYGIIGYDILRDAVRGIWNRQPFDENFLMAVATVGAFCLGEYAEGVAVMLFYQIGELFQSYAVGKSRRNIGALMDIRPDSANLEGADGGVTTIDPNDVPVGSIILIRPGEKIPLDGVVVEGDSTLDTVALTGESAPREVHPGDEVLSGCVNQSGLLRVQTTCEFGLSTVAKILDLVENASAKKSRSERFISKFARVYTPAVCISALALAVLPPLFLGGWGTWIYRALSFLVISCPCALVISIPLGFFAGIGGAGKAGILIKGSNYIETLSQVKTVVFDKTGTLTRGVFDVVDVYENTLPKERVIALAALAESYSSHPISLSLRRAYGKDPRPDAVSDVQELSGRGVRATVDGRTVLVGNDRLLEEHKIAAASCQAAGTVVHVAVDGEYAGYILISDTLKPDAKEAVAALKKSGIARTVMLTGDARSVAESVAGELGIDELHAELLPADKVAYVERLLADSRGKLAFVGDGINDAPVLTRADVGIAMGALGSDAAIEAADVVLMDDSPKKIARAIKIAKKCMRIVYQNIYFAIGIKLLCLVLGAFGVTNMWFAIFADVGVMVLAVLNAVRTLK